MISLLAKLLAHFPVKKVNTAKKYKEYGIIYTSTIRRVEIKMKT
jgi:hypothetical protein